MDTRAETKDKDPVSHSSPEVMNSLSTAADVGCIPAVCPPMGQKLFCWASSCSVNLNDRILGEPLRAGDKPPLS